ncbi:MAG: hypothetical protein OXB88_05525 [Bacteriovoracales bacterium]|nr:hypothetical protein [Bacteriovoracales bacterium]
MIKVFLFSLILLSGMNTYSEEDEGLGEHNVDQPCRGLADDARVRDDSSDEEEEAPKDTVIQQ